MAGPCGGKFKAGPMAANPKQTQSKSSPWLDPKAQPYVEIDG